MTALVPGTETVGLPELRAEFRLWLAASQAELEPFREAGGELAATFDRLSQLQRMLYDAGWIRLGWPAELGGLGGSILLRCIVSEELARAGYPPPFSFGTQEVLGPAVARFASAEVASEFIPKLLRGDETWCQGFSEPGAGSDLGSLQVRAAEVPGGWAVTGEKVWTSWAQFADRCVLLARTGEPGSGPRGISAFFLDMATPGVEVSPLVSMNGDSEFCSITFEDAFIPAGRLMGSVNQGWQVAMFVLACERGAASWQRQAWLSMRLQDLLQSQSQSQSQEARAGEAYEMLTALRLLSRRTVRRLDDGEQLGPETSLDKLCMSTTEKFIFDFALESIPMQVLAASDAASAGFRNDYLYSRAASIYGGAAEIQRNIIAERILGMPRG